MEEEKQNREIQDSAIERRFRTIMENMPAGLMIVHPSGIIETVSPAIENLAGRSALELCGKHVSYLLPKVDDKLLMAWESSGVTSYATRSGGENARPVILAINSFQTTAGMFLLFSVIDVSNQAVL